MIHLGDYRTVLAGMEVDCVITDPPYSEKTHKGHNAQPPKAWFRPSVGRVDGGQGRRKIDYAHWTPEQAREFVEFWSPRCRGWMGILSCDILAPVYRETAIACGRYAFAPVPCVIRGMTVRMSGDGPSSWAVYLNVSRPKGRFIGGWTRPGAYVVTRGTKERTGARIGGKPLELMRQIVGDYSESGDLVCDPCAGYATTGVAALELGRRFVGAEISPGPALVAMERLRSVAIPPVAEPLQEHEAQP